MQLEPGTRGRLEWLHASRDCGVVGCGCRMNQIRNFGAIFSVIVFFSILEGKFIHHQKVEEKLFHFPLKKKN